MKEKEDIRENKWDKLLKKHKVEEKEIAKYQTYLQELKELKLLPEK